VADEHTMSLIRAKQNDLASNMVMHAEAQESVPAVLGAGLRALAGDWRTLAEYWTKSKRRGWQSEASALRRLADAVERVAKDLDALGAEPEPTANPNPHREPLEPPFGEPADVAKLDALVSERVAAVSGNGSSPAEEAAADGQALRDYLSGVTDELVNRLLAPTDNLPSTVEPTPLTLENIAERYPLSAMEYMNATVSQPSIVESETLQPTFADPFTDPQPYTPQPRVPADSRRMSFVDLLAPAPVRDDLQHWSWSQLETLEDCGAKYRMTKLDQLTQVPQWALVGGNALHAAVAEVELSHDAQWAPATTPPGWPDEAALGVLWNRVFHAEIAKVNAEHPGMPMDQWRASKQGKEGYDFWRVEGEHMLVTYVAMRERTTRQALSAGQRVRRLWRDQATRSYDEPVPAVELPFELAVAGPQGTLKVVGILDQAWMTYHYDNGMAADLLLVDLKSGSKMPDDTAQLAVQAWGLVAKLAPEAFNDDPRAAADLLPGRILGMFYDARKGVYTPEVDLLALHPWEEVVYRFHAAEALRRTRAYLPRRSSFCGGCPVRYACPVGGR
jgi:hypothetical protein